ncbi:MAG: ComF family protein [Gemmatimonadales bacterium]|nr:MAG: ComF family protein [Gemmatimonadales bacterium]
MMAAGGWVQAGLDLLLPPGCAVCGGPSGPRCRDTGRAEMLCPRCRTRLRPPTSPGCARCHAPLGSRPGRAQDACRECEDWSEALIRVRSATILVPPADRMVHSLKYGGLPELAAPMARAMARFLPDLEEPGREAVLVPVPTTSDRLRTRGYNQALRLSEELGRRTGRTVVEALRRKRGGGSQVALHREERMANVRGVFEPTEQAEVLSGDRTVIVVDDVLTTGATAGEIAEVLAGAGAGSIRLLVFARALPGRTRDPRGGLEPPPGFFHVGEGRRAAPGTESSATTERRS